MENKTTHQQPDQANFAWALPAAAGGVGLLGGWKLFGGTKETEPNPVLFWSMLAIVFIVLVGFGIFAYKKWGK